MVDARAGPALRGKGEGGVTVLSPGKAKAPQMSEPLPREHMSPSLNENRGNICPYFLFLPEPPKC
jgi:hypothetical protein